MRLIGAGTLAYLLAMTVAIHGTAGSGREGQDIDDVGRMNSAQHGQASQHDDPHRAGQNIFRFDTFGDEQLWTDVLRMHEVIATIDPVTALGVGLKVDVDALPVSVRDALHAGQIDLKDPAVTIELLRLNAVVGVKGS